MGKKILVTDDQVGIRKLLVEILRPQGYEVYECADGLQALDFLKENTVDLMLLDMKMPKMDGITTLKKIKEMDIDVKVVIMTAFGELKVTKDAQKLGAIDYILKPFDIIQLLEVVEKYV
ncbi:response regulator [Anaerobranca gottschalkii]|uniref:Stage 0 sporulation protein A homolog n=1 Tax=Anaerobranca gottschalkii DSM 13577 TaxID=1120990 RepID=A0A1H9ZUF1_9FIRM|nr:response regulator [Anaerobranca gottschalkii]SES85393.1 two-component system, response regulator, stage 0 sporulation protein F [Anaerobranca gottschalkii DSM 13577]